MDLTGYKLTFDDEFNTLSVSNDGPANGTRWTNHMWYGGNPGGIETDVPNAFSVANGAMTITAQKTASGWTGGVLSSVNSSVQGFTQEYGYFEMRAEMPKGNGTWPIFWLISAPHAKDPAQPASELDIFEGQGNQPTTDFTTMHSYATGTHWQNPDNAHQVADTTNGFHTYGLSWNAQTVTWYCDGQVIQQLATKSDVNVPMMIIADLAMGNISGNNYPDATTPSTMGMKIDYIRAFSQDPNAHAVVLGQVSAPDGVDTTPYGASDADGVISKSGTPANQVTLRVSGDHWQGDPQFIVKIDGKQVGGTLSTTAVHDSGAWQNITVKPGTVDPTKAHDISISFINDASGGSHATDRNLYVGGLDVDGHHIAGNAFASNNASLGYGWIDPNAAVMVINGTATYHAGADYWHYA